jgi:GNAT superfamily N-acetyltransferase
VASLYAQYLAECPGDAIIELDNGFLSYRFLPGNRCHILDVYVAPEARRKGVAGYLLFLLIQAAREHNCTFITASVQPTTKTATMSISTQLAYGFVIDSAALDIIVLRKDIV